VISRRRLLGIVAAVLAAPVATPAQQTTRRPRVAVLMLSALSDRPQQWEALRHALRDDGYVDGQNISIEFRSAEGQPERLAELAVEIVKANVDIIVSAGTQATKAAQKATRTIPIVMSNVGDPVGSGIVASLARPGGNVTGVSLLATELSAKRLQILKEVLPALNRLAVLWNPANASVVLKFKETQAAARGFGLQVQSLEVRDGKNLEAQIRAAVQKRAEALFTADDQVLSSERTQIVGLAMRYRLPLASEFREFAEAGGLCSYGASLADSARRAASYVAKILRGAAPALLPIEQPTKFEMVINVKTAKALGITVPESLLLRADQVIE
jgi:putative tryptophan/tyrosine transport system substrate-binding protein